MIIKHWKVCIVFIGKSLNRKEKYICFSMKFKMWMAGKGLETSYSQDFVEESELFMSGSNSKMLSSELATLLSGRY